MIFFALHLCKCLFRVQNVSVEISGDGIGIVGADGYIGYGLHGRDAIAHSYAGAASRSISRSAKSSPKAVIRSMVRPQTAQMGARALALVAVDLVILCQFFFTGKAANITVRQSRLQRFDLLIGGYLGTDLQRIQGKVPEIRPNAFRPGRVRGPLVAVIVPKMALQGIYGHLHFCPANAANTGEYPLDFNRGKPVLIDRFALHLGQGAAAGYQHFRLHLAGVRLCAACVASGGNANAAACPAAIVQRLQIDGRNGLVRAQQGAV